MNDALARGDGIEALKTRDLGLPHGIVERLDQRLKATLPPLSARDCAEQAREARGYLYHLAPGDVIYESVFHHYTFMREVMSQASLDQIASQGLNLWSTRKEDAQYGVHLNIEKYFRWEGELLLEFRLNNRALYFINFSIVPSRYFHAEGSETIFIGRMQGYGAYDDARQAAKNLFEITPQAVLFASLQGIAIALGIPTIVGVCASNQLCFDGDRKEQLERQYDLFFDSIGARRIEGFYLTGALDLPKPLSEIKATHRRRTKAKRNFKQGIRDSVGKAFANLLRPGQTAAEISIATSHPSHLRFEDTLTHARFAHTMMADAESQAKSEELIVLRSKLDSASAENETYARTIREQESEIQDLKTEILNLRSECFNLSDQIENFKQATEGLTAELHMLRSALQGAQADRVALINIVNTAFAQVIAERFKPFAREPIGMTWKDYEYEILKTGIFDENYYIANYPDVAAAAVDPVRHYQELGYREGRDPNAFFSTRKYLETYPDVANSGANPLIHYCLYGASEGRMAIFRL